MSEFLKFAYELIAQIVYNITSCLVGFFGGLLKLFITGWPEYIVIFTSYFGEMTFIAKILAILLCLLLIAIPIVLIYLLIKRIALEASLKRDGADSGVLYREIGRLNNQVLKLMDEKDQILALKVASTGITDGYAAGYAEGAASAGCGPEGGTGMVPVAGGIPVAAGDGMADPLAEEVQYDENGVPIPVGTPVAGGTMVAGGVGVGGITVNGDTSIGESALGAAAAAAATAAAEAKVKAEEEERNIVTRFPKMSLVDAKYEDYEAPQFDDTITLEDFVERYRRFAASQLHLYYTPEIIRRFVAGMSASKILILEGISGTGKTSLPYSLSRFINNPATLIPVQPSFRDRTELVGYFNEFSKRFNETEFLRAMYEALYREDPSFIVLDEMNLARIEYYFAEMLSILELPDQAEWLMDLVPTAWPGDPEKLESGKIKVSPSLWFVGTCNSDDSTFTITDKVYDRAMPIELNERAAAFECDPEPKINIRYEHLLDMFAAAKDKYPITEGTLTKMLKLDQYLQTRFRLSFGNRIMKQMYDFIPSYVACGGSELDALDYIVARKVLKKFESQNVTFVRDEIKGLISYIEKTFGKTAMKDSKAYLERIQNLY